MECWNLLTWSVYLHSKLKETRQYVMMSIRSSVNLLWRWDSISHEEKLLGSLHSHDTVCCYFVNYYCRHYHLGVKRVSKAFESLYKGLGV